MVEEFGEGFGEAIGESLDYESFVDVVLSAKFGSPFISSMDADNEATEVVVLFCNVVIQCEVGFGGFLFRLLAEGVKSDVLFGEEDVVAIGSSGEESVDAGGCEAFFGDDAFKEGLRFLVEFLGNFGSFFVAGLEGFGFRVPDAAEFPGMKKGSPVDVVGEFAKGLGFDGAGAGEFGDGRGVVFPVDSDFVGAGVGEGEGGLFGFVAEVGSMLGVGLVVGGDEFFAVFR